ncbi:MAG: phosphatase PAP2 family protein [Thermoplasmatales archaeon]|nr:phosphatase PAP2 family protein [Thermoplasmatales archaeon]
MCLADEGIVKTVQGIGSPLLDKLFAGVTSLGDIMFYILLISLLYWCFSKKTGLKLFCLVLFLGYFGVFLKNIFRTPRPSKALWKTEAGGYSFPSGHVTVTAGFWGYLMTIMRRKLVTVIGSIIIFLVAFSRLYLGVHFLLDIIGGFLIGIAAALWFYYLETRIKIKPGFYQKIMLCIFIPLIMFLISMNDASLQLCSLLFGLSFGYVLELKTINASNNIKNKTRASRAVIGLILVSAVFLGFGAIPAHLDFIRFILTGLTVTFFAPVVFSKTDKIFR